MCRNVAIYPHHGSAAAGDRRAVPRHARQFHLDRFQQMFAAIEGLPDAVLSDPARYLPWLEAESVKPSDFFAHFHEEHESDMRAWLARGAQQ
ncbi:MAG: hypothetical protein IPO81_15865 [Kouleothrix sp.]|nr:hypothetical protein [Kouleothrix sp.]